MPSGAVHTDLSVVVPVYKEESNIRPFLARLLPVLERISPRYEVLFCLDPSPDRTIARFTEARAAERWAIARAAHAALRERQLLGD